MDYEIKHKFYNHYLLVFSIAILSQSWVADARNTKNSKSNSICQHNITSTNRSIKIKSSLGLNIFCRDPDPMILNNYFRSAKLKLSSGEEDVRFLTGSSFSDVYEKRLQKPGWFSLVINSLPFSQHRYREASFSILNTSCIGVSTTKPYSARHITQSFDKWNFTRLIVGILVFLFASYLCRTAVVLYTFVILFGCVAMMCIMVYSGALRIIKQRELLLPYLVTSGIVSIVFYYLIFFRPQWTIIEDITDEHALDIFWAYCTWGAVIGLYFCYRIGPPNSPRALKIIKYILKACGLFMIYYSSELEGAVLTIIVISLFFNACKAMIAY